MLNQGQYKTTNYMVPSNGQTHAVVYQGQLSGTPFLIDWRQYAIDNEKFQPQGVFIDNTAGTVAVVITILPINFTVTCPAGESMQAQFPAPNGQTCTVTGDPNNSATIIFVDFPVLPSSTQAVITNTPNVNIASISNGVRMPTDGNPLAAGNTLPYRTQEYVPTGEAHAFNVATTGSLSASVTPAAANQNLRKLKIYATGNLTLAAAGAMTITATANGTQIFQRRIYLPNAIPAAPVMGFTVCELDFDNIGINMSAGNLTVSVDTNSVTGSLDVDAYFTPQ